METHQPERGAPNTDVHDDKVRVWPVVRQSFGVLLRHVVPFVLLAAVVGWTVGIVLFLTGLAPFLVLRTLEFSSLFYRQIASVTLHGASGVAVEAVIAMAVWLELGGRRLTLRGFLVTVARAIPGLLHRPFYLFVSRVSAAAIVRALLYVPYHAAVILVLTSELEPAHSRTWLLALSWASTLLYGLIDSRLLMLVPVAAIERGGVLDSIRRCWRLTSRHWTRILGVLVLVGCFSAALKLPSTSLLKNVAGYLRKHDLTVLLSLTILLVNSLVRSCWAVVATVCYRHIRVADGESAAAGSDVPPPA